MMKSSSGVNLHIPLTALQSQLSTRDSQHGFEVLHETAETLVVSKPSGVLTQAPPGIDCLEWRIKRYLQVKESTVKEPYLGVPHRLDRLVSGVMVFGKTKRAARWYAEQFQQHRATKRYWALVSGMIEHSAGVWTDWMRKVDGESRSELVAQDHPQAKHAELHYVVRGRMQNVIWLEITLMTGRSHQIRLQASARGHPVLGDEQYGSQVTFGEQFDDPRLRAIALHARYLAVAMPGMDATTAFEAALPEYWDEYLSEAELEKRGASTG